MRRVLVVGIGPGDPDQITVEALRALRGADVLFELARATEELTRARREICARHLEEGRAPKVVRICEPERDRAGADYERAVGDWRARRAGVWEQAIKAGVPEEGTAAFLVWGDPSLYDSTIAVLERILARGRVAFEYRVIPAVSSLHALTAAHRIALHRVGRSVMITTGRRLREQGFPDNADDVVVMLDGECSFGLLADEPLDIYWGAYLGTRDEILLSGALADVAEQIKHVRSRARERKGWIMDIYLLRRRLS